MAKVPREKKTAVADGPDLMSSILSISEKLDALFAELKSLRQDLAGSEALARRAADAPARLPVTMVSRPRPSVVSMVSHPVASSASLPVSVSATKGPALAVGAVHAFRPDGSGGGSGPRFPDASLEDPWEYSVSGGHGDFPLLRPGGDDDDETV